MRVRMRCYRTDGKVKFHFAALGHAVCGHSKIYVCNGPVSVPNGYTYISVDYLDQEPHTCRFLKFNLG